MSTLAFPFRMDTGKVRGMDAGKVRGMDAGKVWEAEGGRAGGREGGAKVSRGSGSGSGPPSKKSVAGADNSATAVGPGRSSTSVTGTPPSSISIQI